MIEIHSLLTELSPYFTGHLSRIECLSMIIIGMLTSQSVCLAKIAPCIPGIKTKYDSVYKRIQRFFSEFNLDNDEVAKFIMQLFNFESYTLIIDRTNWKFGKNDINYLVLSIAHDNVSVPILWQALPRCANSTTAERINLLNRFIKLFGKDKIIDLCADREFYGEEWISYLIENNLYFTIRFKQNFKDENGLALKDLFKSLPKGNQEILLEKNILGQKVSLVAYRDENNQLTILGTNHQEHKALSRYLKRDQIEHMFRCMKTQGFNLEDTHITEPDRLDKLFSVMSVAFVWAYKFGEFINRNKLIVRKNHGRRLRTIFKTGLIHLHHILIDTSNKLNEFKAIIDLIFNKNYRRLSEIKLGWI